jgi:hypothetical protein
MKKIIILSVVSTILVFAACKKERECECTKTTSSNQPNTSPVTDPAVTYEIKGIKGGEVKSWCQKTTSVITTGSVVITIENDCKLK